MQISKIDVIWNFIATFIKVSSSILLLPLILKLLPSEDVGLWILIASISSVVNLMDFGFSSSFTRNITFIFSGVKELKANGFSEIHDNKTIDLGLLKGTIKTMRRFYFIVSIILFLILATLGTYYISIVLKGYTGNKTFAYIAWGLSCIINTYNLYTLYYDALLTGKGLIKEAKKIIVFTQLVFLLITSIFLLKGLGLISILIAQFISVVLLRVLSYRTFFTKKMVADLKIAPSVNKKKILKAIYPNAIRIGITMIGGILVSKSAIFVGSLYISLTDIASYGITFQILSIISAIGYIYITTYIPQITNFWTKNEFTPIKNLYIKGALLSIVIYTVCGLGLLLLGNKILELIGSNTFLIKNPFLLIALLISFLETNHGIATTGVILTKNEVPFFKAAIISGVSTLILLCIFFKYTTLGLLGMIIAPGIVQAAYNNWRWPLLAISDLKIKFIDIKNIYKSHINFR